MNKNAKRKPGRHSRAYNQNARAIRKISHALRHIDEHNSAKVRDKAWVDAVSVLWGARNAVSLEFETALNQGQVKLWAE